MGLPKPSLLNTSDDLDLSGAITKISEAMTKLLASGLKAEAVVIMISHDTGIAKKTIRAVLDSLGDLSKKYTKST